MKKDNLLLELIKNEKGFKLFENYCQSEFSLGKKKKYLFLNY